MLDRSVRCGHAEDPIENRSAAERLRYSGIEIGPIVLMHSAPQNLEPDLAAWLDLQDPIQLVRPVMFVGFDIDREGPEATQASSLFEERFCPSLVGFTFDLVGTSSLLRCRSFEGPSMRSRARLISVERREHVSENLVVRFLLDPDRHGIDCAPPVTSIKTNIIDKSAGGQPERRAT